ncbi:MAG: hypothetical protein ACJAV4_000660 [Pontimonas sp.]|jgi:hypothetical protein
MSTPEPVDRQKVRVRRSPKLSAFVAVFGLLGFFGTLILTGLFPSDPSIGFVALFAYFALYGVTGTIGLGMIVWLVLDLISRKRARELNMGRETTGGTS